MNALHQILLLGWNDLRRAMKNRQAFLWMILMPIGMTWLFGTAFKAGSAEEPTVYLAVDDRDGGWLASALVDELAGGQLDPQPLAERASDAGPPPRTLVLPEGLSDEVLAGGRAVVRLEVDAEADQQFSFGAEVAIRRALVKVTGRMLTALIDPASTDPSASSVEQRFQELRDEQPLVALDVSRAGRGRPVPSGFAQSVPGMLTMTVLMMTLIYGGNFLVQEKQQGMLRRQMALPMPRIRVVAGKLVGRLLIATVQIVALLLAGTLAFQIDVGRSPLALLLLLTSFALAVSALATMLGAVFTTMEQVSSVGWILSMALAGIGGCWWPFEIMPEWLRTAAHALPTTWAMQGFHALISYGRGVDGVWLPSLVLTGFAVVFVVVAARLLRDH